MTDDTTAAPRAETSDPASSTGTEAEAAAAAGQETGKRRSERVGTVVAVGLALVGLFGALIAWRVVDLGTQAGDASRSAVSAARERSEALLAAEARVSLTYAAWLTYELDRRRADALREAGHLDVAAREDKAASAHWGFVDPEYIDPDGLYQPDDHVDGIVAGQATQVDLEAAPHLAAATAAEARTTNLALIAVVIAGALPLLTAAEVGRGRVRFVTGIGGAALLATGIVALAVSWA